VNKGRCRCCSNYPFDHYGVVEYCTRINGLCDDLIEFITNRNIAEVPGPATTNKETVLVRVVFRRYVASYFLVTYLIADSRKRPRVVTFSPASPEFPAGVKGIISLKVCNYFALYCFCR